MQTPKILSIQVGRPRQMHAPEFLAQRGKTWRSGIIKEPVDGPVWLGEEGLTGDGQADRRVHGGPRQAVLVYAASHYPAWHAELAPLLMPHGAFGENFTVSELDEEQVCIGDIYRVGEALVQVTKPRGPCWKLVHRWKVPDLVERVQASGRTGWYLRVLEQGHVEAGQDMELVESPNPGQTIRLAQAR